MSVEVKDVKINGYSLLNIRLVWYSFSFAHIVWTAFVSLSIDLSRDKDPSVRAYGYVRWGLMTFWYNVILLVYLPLCLYCDWYEKRGGEPPYVQRLRILRDVVMTSILMPVTTFADITFWLLFKSHSNIMAPARVFAYVPLWVQHSLHTVSMITVVMDLLLTPRRKPRSMLPGLALVLAFGSSYCLMVYIYLLQGDAVYSFLATASGPFLIGLYIFFNTFLSLCYYAQWHLIEYVWGQKDMKLGRKSAKIK